MQTHDKKGGYAEPQILNFLHTISEFVNKELAKHKNELGTIQIKGAFSLEFRFDKTVNAIHSELEMASENDFIK